MTTMAISVSALRQNIYKLIDEVLQTGKPLEIDRNGEKLLITPAPNHDRLGNLRKRDVINCEPEDLVHLDWSGEWKP